MSWRRAWVWGLGLVLGLVLALVSVWAVTTWQEDRARVAAQRRGQALFAGQVGHTGQTDLMGRVVGHELVLPSLATRCSNCHHVGAATAGTVVAAAVPVEAPSAVSGVVSGAVSVLNREGLARPQFRRGGPPSVYDAQRLCLLLRTGRDAADVIVSTTMPRYSVSDAQCADLWAYLHAS